MAQAGLEHCFSLVVGYEEVGFWRQKPAPDGLLFCLAELGIDEGEVLFVGDHETDIECARRANRALIETGEAVTVVAVAAEFGGHGGTVWSTAPDYVVGRPAEVVGLVRGDGLG